MKRSAVVLLFLSACATARTVPSPEAGVTPARMLARMAHARLAPPLRLRGMALGTTYYTMDMIMGGSPPSAAGVFPCSTGANAGAWESPTACFGTSFSLDASGSTTTSPATLTWANWSGGEAIRLAFGDLGTALQVGFGDRLQMYSYNDIDIVAGRATTTALAFAPGNAGAGDINLTAGATGQVVVNSPIIIGSTGTQISASYRTTISLSSASCPAQACTQVGSVTITGAQLGAECITSGTATNGGWDTKSVFVCGVRSTNTVALECCNTSASTDSILAATYSVRVFNP